MKKLKLSLKFMIAVFVVACSEDNYTANEVPEDPFAELNLPETYFNYTNISLPSFYIESEFPVEYPFPPVIEYDNTPTDNPITNAGATLGRVLFYDKKLSANGTVSCASCHQAQHGFSDPNILSEGFEGGHTRRHSMGIVNARFYANGKFFWDERAETLEEQVLMPFQNEVEMGLTLQELIDITSEQTYYPPLFEQAFGDETINSDRISKALAQFIRSLVSVTSKYDQARSEVTSPLENFPGFTAQENAGKLIFYTPRQLTNGNTGYCIGCHQTEAFIGPVFPITPSTFRTFATTNGIDAVSITDLGVTEATGNSGDIGKFKVPSLKNIAITAPYMHDGRFATLEEVIDHYSSSIQNHQNLRPPLVNSSGQVGQFNFSQEEKDALIAFLNTLTDYQMLTDEKFSNPFE
ncbi:cytochrome-c peroxidase [Pontimicrobium sp. IMCC45349]|uniref:cytochrome-c peroxidase n=1 Tax=Pontimicrobium sp. IMCC45349 TaxID=3391574 RepID=UPI0039A24A18